MALQHRESARGRKPSIPIQCIHSPGRDVFLSRLCCFVLSKPCGVGVLRFGCLSIFLSCWVCLGASTPLYYGRLGSLGLREGPSGG